MTAQPVIQVGFDNSWRDTGALEWALQEANLRQEPIRAVHVIDDSLRRTAYWEPTVVDDAAMDLVDSVRKELAADDGGLDHEADLLAGPPAATLAQTAEGSTMLVVGRRGMGAFKRLLIGSTSEAVVHRATVPVVVVPDGWKPGDHIGPVVVAVDESEEQHAAMKFAITAAAERKVPLRIVHVWDLPNIYSWDASVVAGIDEELAEKARRRWDAVAEQWRQKYPALDIEVDVRRGHAVDGVVSAAQDADAQLLVVGGRRHHRVTSVLLGSVARGVLHHATCPVAVVHTS
ncbi:MULTISPECIES: universal stress protein [unclassified Kribbella]|uniref:universal stress protein n=1 Tax=unclassified Kribbella TaxID=2644121 RepID=UPI003018FF22